MALKHLSLALKDRREELRVAPRGQESRKRAEELLVRAAKEAHKLLRALGGGRELQCLRASHGSDACGGRKRKRLATHEWGQGRLTKIVAWVNL